MPAWLRLALAAGVGVWLGWSAVRRWRRPVLLIDPGHGGPDPGAVHGGSRESDLVLAMARQLRGYWPTGAGFTRSGDHAVSLAARVEAADTADLVLSLHVNAALDAAAVGAEAWANTAGMPYAEAIAAAWTFARGGGADLPRWRRVVAASAWRDAAGRPGLWITRTERPTVLLELGFISNPAEREWLRDPRRRDLALKLVAETLAATRAALTANASRPPAG